jgi:hypothetical protein
MGSRRPSATVAQTGQAQLAGPIPQPLAAHATGTRPERARARSPHAAMANACAMARSPVPHRQRKTGANGGETNYNLRYTCCYMMSLKGSPGEGFSSERPLGWRRPMASRTENSVRSKERPWDRFFSCRKRT